MAKKVHDDVLDGALSVLKNHCDRMTVCAGEPLSYAEASAGAKYLAGVTMAGGDFVIGDGAQSGRRAQVAAKGGITVEQDGTVDHIALLDTAGERVLYVTTCVAQVLTAGNSLAVNGWSIEIADPA